MPQAPLAYYVIGDEDTVLGFRYAGVSGEVVTSAQEARNAFEQAVEQRRARILIIADVIAETIRDEVNAVRTGKPGSTTAPHDGEVPGGGSGGAAGPGRPRVAVPLPLVVEIPGPRGPMPGKRTLLELMQEAVGVRM